MSMTEQEIRADERAKLVRDLWNIRPFLHDQANAGMTLAIQYIKGANPVPKPEPNITLHWVTCAAPAKDWRDVPITAGMLVDAYGGDYPELTRPVERAARVKASQALINEAAQKGWP